MICLCAGKEHVVCRPKWRVPMGNPFPKTATLTLGKAVAQGLVIRPEDPRWAERRAKPNYYGDLCTGCGRKDEGRECLTCLCKRLRETPAELVEVIA